MNTIDYAELLDGIKARVRSKGNYATGRCTIALRS